MEEQKTRSYDDILKQAMMYPPITKFVDSDGIVKGLYRIGGGIVRALPISDVERKSRELKTDKTPVREDE